MMKHIFSVVCWSVLLLAGCSPIDNVEDKLDSNVTAFERKYPERKKVESRAFIYDIGAHKNYLGDPQVFSQVLEYALLKDSAQMQRNGVLTVESGVNYDTLAHRAKEKILHLLTREEFVAEGGVWALQNISYKEGDLEQDSVKMVRRLFLFSFSGYSEERSAKVGFDQKELEDLMKLTQTEYSEVREWEYVPFEDYLLGTLFIIGLFIFIWKRNKKQRLRLEAIRKKQEAERLEKERLEAAERWNACMARREMEYGQLTKHIRIGEEVEQDIYVYALKQVIFIKGKQVDFEDVLSCSVEKQVYEKGEAVQTTQPDPAEMLFQQLLFGGGKRYNVRSTSRYKTTPDKYKYQVSIGLRSISEPQIFLTIYDSEVANEVKNLMNAIIAGTDEEGQPE